jgi:hypothetical protein
MCGSHCSSSSEHCPTDKKLFYVFRSVFASEPVFLEGLWGGGVDFWNKYEQSMELSRSCPLK